VMYFIIAFVIVLSRVFVCHHFITDVVVGSYVAVITTLCLKQFLDKSGIAIQE
jgi:membrane-associated phospholipid phosphatase